MLAPAFTKVEQKTILPNDKKSHKINIYIIKTPITNCSYNYFNIILLEAGQAGQYGISVQIFC